MKQTKNALATKSISRSVMSDSLQFTWTNPPGFSIHGILEARILDWIAIPLLRQIFPSQGSNPGLLHCRQILYRLSLFSGYENVFEIGLFIFQKAQFQVYFNSKKKKNNHMIKIILWLIILACIEKSYLLTCLKYIIQSGSHWEAIS